MSRISGQRRRLVWALALACLLGGFVRGESVSPARPNILFLVGDDHATHVFGAYGGAPGVTPHLDRLAQSGARFERAYCNSPVCTASRASFLTGRLPHSVGVTLLRTPLGDAPVTLAELLKPLGYKTAALGKMHFNSAREHGFDLLYDHPQIARETGGRAPLPIPEAVRTRPEWRPFKDPARIWLNAEVLPVARLRADMPSTRVTDQAVAYLRAEAAKPSEERVPFFLMVSLYEPHSPFDFPVELAGTFDPAAFEVPEVGPGDDAQIPGVFRDLTLEEKRGIIAAYHTSARFLDENMGRVLTTLDETGLAGSTVVVYIGDHGYNLGHHGRFEKHCFYEPAVRAPLVVRWPGKGVPGVEISALTEFIDIFPTIAEICGAAIPAEVEGKSLVPLLECNCVDHREAVFSEYFENEEAMVFDGRHKLVYSTGKRARQDGYATGRDPVRHEYRLFDLQEDPGEFHNLAGSERHRDVLEALKAEMLHRLSSQDRGSDGVEPEWSFEQKMDGLLVPPEERMNHGVL